MSTNWWLMCQGMGYKTPKEMWEDLYITQELSLEDIAVRCRLSKQCVRRQLKLHNIDRRPRGGVNHTSIAYDLRDQINFNRPTGELCKLLNVSRRTILRVKRTTKSEDSM